MRDLSRIYGWSAGGSNDGRSRRFPPPVILTKVRTQSRNRYPS